MDQTPAVGNLEGGAESGKTLLVEPEGDRRPATAKIITKPAQESGAHWDR